MNQSQFFKQHGNHLVSDVSITFNQLYLIFRERLKAELRAEEARTAEMEAAAHREAYNDTFAHG